VTVEIMGVTPKGTIDYTPIADVRFVGLAAA
jgi:hypothetical protein